MTILAKNTSVTLYVKENGKITISMNGGLASVQIKEGATVTAKSLGPVPTRETFGPYKDGAKVLISNNNADLDYDLDIGNTNNKIIDEKTGYVILVNNFKMPQLRAPTPEDNAALGYTSTSLWQHKGQLYQPVTAPTNTSAVWSPLQRSGATVVDVLGSAATRFAGGTVAMARGFTGPAIDISVIIATVPTAFTINIIAGGELDNVAVQGALARRDAGTNVSVTQIYDQSGNANHVVKDASYAAPLLDWDAECGRYVITSDYIAGSVNQLRIPNTVTVGRNSLTMICMGRSTNSHSDGGTRAQMVAGDFLGGAGQIAAWQPTLAGSMMVSNNPAGGAQAPDVVVPFLNNLSISGMTAGVSANYYFSNELSSTRTFTNNVATLTGGWIGSDTGTGSPRRMPMRFFGIALANVAATLAQLEAIKQGFYTQFNVFPQNLNRVVIIGDSRSAGAFATLDKNWTVALTNYLTSKPIVINFGAGSQTNALAAANTIPSAVSLYKSGVKNIAVILMGVNDFIASGLSVEQSVAALTANVTTLKAAGYKVIVIAELATTNTTNSANTRTALLQNSLKLNSVLADEIVDVGIYPEVIAASNTAYYTDGLHPSAALSNLIAGKVAASVNNMLES